MKTESGILLSTEDRARLEGWVAGRNTPQKLVWRARIVLMWAQGAGVTAIVEATGKTKKTRTVGASATLNVASRGWNATPAGPGASRPLTLRRSSGWST